MMRVTVAISGSLIGGVCICSGGCRWSFCVRVGAGGGPRVLPGCELPGAHENQDRVHNGERESTSQVGDVGDAEGSERCALSILQTCIWCNLR